MASPSEALRRVRRARREEAPPKTTEFGRYEPEYREILAAVRDAGGDPAIDEVTDWMVERVHRTGTLPEPSDVRTEARNIARKRELSLPEGSPLRADRE